VFTSYFPQQRAEDHESVAQPVEYDTADLGEDVNQLDWITLGPDPSNSAEVPRVTDTSTLSPSLLASAPPELPRLAPEVVEESRSTDSTNRSRGGTRISSRVWKAKFPLSPSDIPPVNWQPR
jgi:hypothetical protein